MKVKGNDNGNFVNPDPGTYLARCVKIIDIGTQYGEYQGKPTARRQIVVGWELPTELIQEGDAAGQPFSVSKFYTLTLSEKSNLRHDLKNWRTRDFTEEELDGFEMANILGKGCMVSLTETATGRIKVDAVAALPRGTKLPPQVNPSVMFSLDPEEFDPEVYMGLSDWFKETIGKSPEYRECINGAKESGAPDPDPSDPLFGDTPPF